MARGTILFDLDGTLVDSAGDLAGSLDTLMAAKIAKERGAWYGRLFKRIVEWLIFEVGL